MAVDYRLTQFSDASQDLALFTSLFARYVFFDRNILLVEYTKPLVVWNLCELEFYKKTDIYTLFSLKK